MPYLGCGFDPLMHSCKIKVLQGVEVFFSTSQWVGAGITNEFIPDPIGNLDALTNVSRVTVRASSQASSNYFPENIGRPRQPDWSAVQVQWGAVPVQWAVLSWQVTGFLFAGPDDPLQILLKPVLRLYRAPCLSWYPSIQRGEI